MESSLDSAELNQPLLHCISGWPSLFHTCFMALVHAVPSSLGCLQPLQLRQTLTHPSELSSELLSVKPAEAAGSSRLYPDLEH